MTQQVVEQQTSRAYRGYVLFVLMLVYVFNFLDRQILAILAEDIKADLGINDAAMGFLLGTSFAVFYAIFGIPLGRAADLVDRTKLIAFGLTLWSALTSLSGAASGFVSLALCRMGVGVGEASANPAAYSLLYDYFPKRVRTTVLAVYSSGIFVGAGLGLIIGGFILTYWKQTFPDPSLAPLSLKAWQAAFIAVGLPGLSLAIMVYMLKEPVRGAIDGVSVPPHPHPWRTIFMELATLAPVFGLTVVGRAGGMKAAFINLAIAGIMALAAYLLANILGGATQWYTLGYGVYAFATWAQKLRLVDPDRFEIIFKSKPLVFSSLGFSGCFFLTAGMLAWLAVFFQRVHGAPAAEVGTVLGLSYAICGFAGVIIGGMITDRVVSRVGDRGRVLVAAAAVVSATLSILALLIVDDKTTAYLLTIPFNFLSAIYVAPGAATVNSLAPAHARATASAAYIICQVFLGTALGPYVVGALSDALASGGTASAEALRGGMQLSLLASLPSLILLITAYRQKWPEKP